MCSTPTPKLPHGRRLKIQLLAYDTQKHRVRATTWSLGCIVAMPHDCVQAFLYLYSMTDLCVVRYAPHVDRNLSWPRIPANITGFVAYMNRQGLFVRGGDVWISDSRSVNRRLAFKSLIALIACHAKAAFCTLRAINILHYFVGGPKIDIWCCLKNKLTYRTLMSKFWHPVRWHVPQRCTGGEQI